MSNSKVVAVRIPDRLLEQIDQIAIEKYRSIRGIPNRSQLILEAIDSFVNQTLSIDSSLASKEEFKLSDIVNKLEEINHRLDSLEAKVEDSQITSTMFDTVNKTHESTPRQESEIEKNTLYNSVKIDGVIQEPQFSTTVYNSANKNDESVDFHESVKTKDTVLNAVNINKKELSDRELLELLKLPSEALKTIGKKRRGQIKNCKYDQFLVGWQPQGKVWIAER